MAAILKIGIGKTPLVILCYINKSINFFIIACKKTLLFYYISNNKLWLKIIDIAVILLYIDLVVISIVMNIDWLIISLGENCYSFWINLKKHIKK